MTCDHIDQTKTTMPKILDSKSTSGAEPAVPSLISSGRLVAIYVAMVKCRMLEQRAATLFQQGKLDADLHASSGREGCGVAVCVDLQPEDTVSIVCGDWIPGFVKGLSAEVLFRALSPRADGRSRSVAEEAQRQNILLHEDDADQPEAVRERSEELRAAKKPAIVAAFLPPGTGLPTQWQKVLSTAAAKKLPVLFVRPGGNNGQAKAVSTRGRSQAPQALFHGVPSIAVDAADPVALYRVAFEAITRARQGRGTTMLECAALPANHSADSTANPAVLRPDPMASMEIYLKRKGIQPELYNRQAVGEFTHDLDLATRFLSS